MSPLAVPLFGGVPAAALASTVGAIVLARALQRRIRQTTNARRAATKIKHLDTLNKSRARAARNDWSR